MHRRIARSRVWSRTAHHLSTTGGRFASWPTSAYESRRCQSIETAAAVKAQSPGEEAPRGRWATVISAMHVSCARETAHEELTTLSQHRYLRLTDMILIAGEKGERSIVVVADVVVDGRRRRSSARCCLGRRRARRRRCARWERMYELG